jgi:hypothetical protein
VQHWLLVLLLLALLLLVLPQQAQQQALPQAPLALPLAPLQVLSLFLLKQVLLQVLLGQC